jgi:hypothetical protein
LAAPLRTLGRHEAELTLLERDLARETTLALAQYHEAEGPVPGVLI